MDKSFASSLDLSSYLNRTFTPEDPVLAEIRERSTREGLPEIQVGRMDALHLEVLTRACGARKAVEIGTLGGYSGTAILRGLNGGTLYTFEYEPKHARAARESFTRAGFGEKQARIFVGPAFTNLREIEGEGPFDLVFIDADKENYPRYLDWAAAHLRVGGVVLGDNAFGWGMITQDSFDDAEDERNVLGLQEFNRRVAQSGRFRATMLPTGEGLVLAVKIK